MATKKKLIGLKLIKPYQQPSTSTHLESPYSSELINQRTQCENALSYELKARYTFFCLPRVDLTSASLFPGPALRIPSSGEGQPKNV